MPLFIEIIPLVVVQLLTYYSDRMEFISLGGLISGLSLEAVMLGAVTAYEMKSWQAYFIE